MSRHGAALGLFLLVFGVYALNAGGHPYSIDEEGYFLSCESLLAGRFHLSLGPERAPVITTSDPYDRPVFIGNIGQSIVAMPLLAGAYVLDGLVAPDQRGFLERVFVGWTNSVTGALTACLLFACLHRLGSSRRAAMAVALVFAFGTFFMPHSKTFFTEPTAALFLLASFYFGLVARQERGRARARALLLLGFASGFAVNVRISLSVLVAVCACGVLRSLLRERADPPAVLGSVAWIALGAFPPIAFLLWSQWVRFGNPFDVGYPNIAGRFNTPIYEGVFGLLASPGKGVFWFAPVTLLAVAAFARFARRRPQVAIEVGAVVLVNIVVFARFDIWSGDDAYGPRYMAIVLPMMLIPLATVEWGRASKSALVALGVLGLLLPSAAGSITYFNNVHVRYQGEIAQGAGVDLTAMENDPGASERMSRARWFVPRYSQLVQQVSLAPDTVGFTVQLLTDRELRSSIEAPRTERGRLYWFFAIPVLDSWVFWLLCWHGPKWLYVFAVVFGVAGLAGAYSIHPHLRPVQAGTTFPGL